MQTLSLIWQPSCQTAGVMSVQLPLIYRPVQYHTNRLHKVGKLVQTDIT